jgi:regulator of sigma E protease
MDYITGIAYLLIILSILVIVHEWGHFAVAKFFKMRVEEFALFFGPILLRLGKKGETEYNIRSVPLGGFVRIAGMEPDDISGGRPILEAICDPQFNDPSGLVKLVKQLEADTMAEIDPANISPEVREMLHSSVNSRGELDADRREELEMKQASPKVNDDEKKLIQMVLLADSRATDPGLYSQKPIYQRALAIFGGPFMSLFFGYALFCILGVTVGLPTDKYTNQVQVDPNGSARTAGLKTGDRIVAINGVPTRVGKDLTEKIHSSVGVPLTLTIQRDDQTMPLVVTPQPKEVDKFDKNGKPVLDSKGKPVKETIGLIGVMPIPTLERVSPIEAVKDGTLRTWGYVDLLVHVVFSKEVGKAVGGPIAMGQTASAVQKLGFAHMLYMAASFSLSLGIMNLLPIPILDGGHLLLLGLEKVRRRKLTPREVYRAQMVGLAMLGAMVVFVMFNDIFRTLAGHSIQ